MIPNQDLSNLFDKILDNLNNSNQNKLFLILLAYSIFRSKERTTTRNKNFYLHTLVIILFGNCPKERHMTSGVHPNHPAKAHDKRRQFPNKLVWGVRP